MYFFELYHQQSKHSPEKLPSPQPMADWPAEWKTVYFKDYPRFPARPLPKPIPIENKLAETLLKRKTERTFSRQVTIDQLSTLLFYGIGEKSGQEHRMYPSAGARYPLEFYLFVMEPINNITPGIYHYNCSQHTLTKIGDLKTTDTTLSRLSIDDSFTKAQFVAVATATFSRTSMKYGERAYRFCLLEAGAAYQNLSLLATALGIGSMHLGGAIDTEIERLLDIDGHEESVVSVICFG